MDSLVNKKVYVCGILSGTVEKEYYNSYYNMHLLDVRTLKGGIHKIKDVVRHNIKNTVYTIK